MRPIRKPALPDIAFAAPASALLINSFGGYCAFSEQRVPDRCFLFHKRFGIVNDSVSRDAWKDILLISEDSARAQLGKTPRELLWPDEVLTFRFNDRSPFQYKLREVTSSVLDENGEKLKATQEKRVIVSGTNASAADTIDFFELNTRYFDPETNTFSIPLHEHQAGIDRRVIQRTEVWHLAEDLAGYIREADAQGESLIEQGRRAIASHGYWSTWASSLLSAEVGFETVSRLLMPDETVEWETGPGPHNTFPGTNIVPLD